MPETETTTSETDTLEEDYARCGECSHSRDFYKRACTACDGTSEFKQYVPPSK